MLFPTRSTLEISMAKTNVMTEIIINIIKNNGVTKAVVRGYEIAEC